MKIRFRVDIPTESLYRDEEWWAQMPVPVVGDLVRIEGRLLLVITRIINTGLTGPFVELHLDPGKKPFSMTGWMIMEVPSGEG